jgi:hypothetical protein
MSVILLNPLGAVQTGAGLVRWLRLLTAEKPRRALGEEEGAATHLIGVVLVRQWW